MATRTSPHTTRRSRPRPTGGHHGRRAAPGLAAADQPAPSRRHHVAFWAVAYAFLAVMAFSAVPTRCTRSTSPGMASRR